MPSETPVQGLRTRPNSVELLRSLVQLKHLFGQPQVGNASLLLCFSIFFLLILIYRGQLSRKTGPIPVNLCSTTLRGVQWETLTAPSQGTEKWKPQKKYTESGHSAHGAQRQ